MVARAAIERRQEIGPLAQKEIVNGEALATELSPPRRASEPPSRRRCRRRWCGSKAARRRRAARFRPHLFHGARDVGRVRPAIAATRREPNSDNTSFKVSRRTPSTGKPLRTAKPRPSRISANAAASDAASSASKSRLRSQASIGRRRSASAPARSVRAMGRRQRQTNNPVLFVGKIAADPGATIDDVRIERRHGQHLPLRRPPRQPGRWETARAREEADGTSPGGTPVP